MMQVAIPYVMWALQLACTCSEHHGYLLAPFSSNMPAAVLSHIVPNLGQWFDGPSLTLAA